MATFNKFNSFVDYLSKAQVNAASDAFKVMLTNTAPIATNTNYASISSNEVAGGNGYTTGGSATTVGLSNSSGTETWTASNVVFTASGGPIGPFRYPVVYDATTGVLIGWWDYGSSILLNSGETFTVAPSGGDLLTLA